MTRRLIWMFNAPELTVAFADELTKVALVQLRTSRDNKRARMKAIKENEDFYYNIIAKSLRNPFNDCFPFMSGFVDTLMAKIDDAPKIKYGYTDIADYKLSLKYTAAFEVESESSEVNNKWPLKDRLAKRNAIFSGRAIYKYYAESFPDYMSNLFTVDHYDFHCEPRGGTMLENHLFCGEEGIFKTKEELIDGAANGYYDGVQVQQIIHPELDRKDNTEVEDDRVNRERDLGLDSTTNNYVGQDTYRFCEWYLTYKGFRWYLLFNIETGVWVRAKLLTDVFPSGKYPYVTWATNEESVVFWSKAPADDAKIIAKNINLLLNQELYNRQKNNDGQHLYDPTMIKDIDALVNPRPDGKIPVDTKNGTKPLANAVYAFKTGEIKGTIDMVSFLDSYSGQKSGVTPSTQGASDQKRVGIYFGDLKEVQDRLGLLNNSYREAWQEIGVRFMEGVDEHMSKPMELKIMGPKGYEQTTLSNKEKRARAFNIKVTGGTIEEQKDAIKNQQKQQALALLVAVNPRWHDEQILKTAGWSDEDIRNAFDGASMADKEIISMAAQAIDQIISGKTPRKFLGATAGYMQYIIDEATRGDYELETFTKLLDFAMSHADTAIRNENLNADKLLRAKMMSDSGMGAGDGGGPISTVRKPVVPNNTPNANPSNGPAPTPTPAAPPTAPPMM